MSSESSIDRATGAAERRRHARFEDDLHALCFEETGEEGFRSGRITEVSIQGARLEADAPFTPGSQVYLGIFLEPSGGPLVALGTVQHCEARPGGAAAMGILFLSTTQEQRATLERLSDYLAARHGETARVTLRAAPAIRQIRDERWWQPAAPMRDRGGPTW